MQLATHIAIQLRTSICKYNYISVIQNPAAFYGPRSRRSETQISDNVHAHFSVHHGYCHSNTDNQWISAVAVGELINTSDHSDDLLDMSDPEEMEIPPVAGTNNYSAGDVSAHVNGQSRGSFGQGMHA